MTNIVKNNSKAYGYNYASLSDIAMQGYEIPKMKTGTENGREYVFVYDKELKEWIRGAEIVIPQSKGQNEAQQYGSGLTYARRYSTLMHLCLCCDDDKSIETARASNRQIEYITKLYDAMDIAKIIQYYQVESINDLNSHQATEVISRAKERNEQIKANKSDGNS